ncbi:MAG: tetratricopeptide repeat protein [Candidatus Eiseniibacteriota bacterium]
MSDRSTSIERAALVTAPAIVTQGALFALVVLVGVAGAVATASAQAPQERTRIEVQRPRSILIGAASRYGDDEPSLLPLADEQKVERARGLVRQGYPEQAENLLADVESRHPDDLDVLLARAELISRQTPGAPTLRFLEERARRAPVAKALQERPFRAGFWLRYEAEALALEDRTSDAANRALRAWERSPDQAAWARTRLEVWSGGRVETLAKEVGKLADRHPERSDLALEAARYEAMIGKTRQSIARVKKLEARTRGSGSGRDATAALPEGERPGAPDALLFGDPAAEGLLSGGLLWQLALSLRARADDGGRAADSVFVELALGDYDPMLKRNAVRNLFEDRIAGPRDLVPDVPVWVEPPRALDRAPQDPNAEAARLLALERVWRDLPRTPENVRLGLELSDRFSRFGDEVGARRVAEAAADRAAKTPGLDADPEVRGRLALESAEVALASGDLDGAVRHYIDAGQSGASDAVREEAAFGVCEVLFYKGEFDSAAALYDMFARAFPGSRHGNDALDRVYLIEAGEGAPVAGLSEFSKAVMLESAGKLDAALSAGRDAVVRAGDGPVWSYAGLLVANVLGRQGKNAEAAKEALAIAEGRPDDRLAPMARRRAGDFLHAEGNDAGALAQYEELLVRYPRSWLAPETRRLVQSLRARAGSTQ